MLQRIRQFRFLPESLIILGFVVVKVLFHMLLPEYGFHRDEMYYVSIADGFSFSNLDMPPGSVLYLKLFLVLFGHSLKVVHLAASLCGAIVIAFGCLIARELGGKRYAMVLTGTFLLFSGLLIFGSLYSYDDVSFVVWAAVFYVIIKMLNGADQRLWLVVGFLMGIGVLTKLTILFLGLGIFVSLWLVPQRRWYRSPWIWVGGVIALLCGIPYGIWQWQHGWYFLSYAENYAGRTTHASPVLDFLWNQILPNNPLLVPIWLTGLLMLLIRKDWKLYRFFGYCYFVLCVSLFILGGQFYFVIPMYAVLIAAGSVQLEQWIAMIAGAGRRVTLAIAVPVVAALLSLPMLPFAVPLLPPDLLARYLRPVGVNAGVKTEDRRITDLPQHMADRFGWDDMARDVAAVYREVGGESSDTVGITAGNWGEASAIHVYRNEFDLPEPTTGDGWFYFETAHHPNFKRSYVSVGVSRAQLQSLFQSVVRKGIYTNPHCMPDENNNAIFFCTGPTVDLGKYWRVMFRMDLKFAEVLQRGGIDSAVEYFHAQRKLDSSTVLFSERSMNQLGYRYLNQHQIDDALKLFGLNIEAYPRSFNVYDSYAEALMVDHQYLLARQEYERSLELNPGNDNAKKKLAEIQRLAAVN